MHISEPSVQPKYYVPVNQKLAFAQLASLFLAFIKVLKEKYSNKSFSSGHLQACNEIAEGYTFFKLSLCSAKTFAVLLAKSEVDLEAKKKKTKSHCYGFTSRQSRIYLKKILVQPTVLIFYFSNLLSYFAV